MLEAIGKHKWRVIAGVALLGTLGSLYKLRLQPKLLLPSLVPEDPAKAKRMKEEMEASSKKEKMYKAFMFYLNKKIVENVSFVEAQIAQRVALAKLNDDVNSLSAFEGADNLARALGYVTSGIFVQRFIYLIVILQMALQSKKSLVKKKEEEKSSEMVLLKPDSMVLLKAMTEFITGVIDEIMLLANARARQINVSHKEAQELFTGIYQEAQNRYCSFQPKEEAKEIESYNLAIVNEFLSHIERTADFTETKAWMESLYFQSLLVEGIEIDFKALSFDYTKMLAIVYQNPHITVVNNRDIAFSLLKVCRDYMPKRMNRYKADISADNDMEFIARLVKMLSSESKEHPEDQSKGLRQSLKAFLNVVLFEENAKKNPLAELPDLSSLLSSELMENQLFGC
eukprot:TRINITY_DN2493_c0_g1_i4.p1 TRINITY_DN2493_c0_g1~~TRINITY_DN2493_c0_g1_i4.p1  ORF type:complete len:398 (-),score=132.07 TRINITY_DN2493_c0_g1_i4:152-1345(-)